MRCGRMRRGAGGESSARHETRNSPDSIADHNRVLVRRGAHPLTQPIVTMRLGHNSGGEDGVKEETRYTYASGCHITTDGDTASSDEGHPRAFLPAS